MFIKNIKSKLIAIIVLALIISNSFISFINSETVKKIASKSITLNIDQVTIPVNGVIYLDYKLKPINSTDKVTWTSNNEEIAIVNQGMVIGISEGTATITVKTSSGKKDKCKVTVTKQWTKNEIIQLIKENSIKEENIKDLIKLNSITEEQIQNMIDVTTKDLQPVYNNYYSTNYSTISQNEFNSMYNKIINRPISETTNIPCYPSQEFEWITTDVYALSGSAIKVRISSMNSTLSSNDFNSISYSMNKDKVYTKYTGNVIITGYIEQDFPIVHDETIYLDLSTVSNGVETRGIGGGALINPDGSFVFNGKIYTNSIIDEIIFRKAEIYGYRYGIYD